VVEVEVMEVVEVVEGEVMEVIQVELDMVEEIFLIECSMSVDKAQSNFENLQPVSEKRIRDRNQMFR
jgi:hypothetical protein